jgi:hypothetical protein
MIPDAARDEIARLVGEFQATRDPGHLLLALDCACRWCDVPDELGELVKTAFDRWAAGRVDPLDVSSLPCRDLDVAFGAKPRGPKFKAPVATLRAAELEMSMGTLAFYEVERQRKRGRGTDRRRTPNAFSEAAKVLPKIRGKAASAVTLERAWSRVRKLSRDPDSHTQQ